MYAQAVPSEINHILLPARCRTLQHYVCLHATTSHMETWTKPLKIVLHTRSMTPRQDLRA
ncbi:hypothetical protein LEMLEM_LOCUS10160, partial [Lemmus lemmus]